MTTTQSSTPITHRQVLGIFSGLMLGMGIAALDQTIVATALPTITGELGGLNHLSWVVTTYLLAVAVSTPLYGKLGDLYGRKRLFQTSIVVFLVGSILCGVAQSMAQLIAFRAIQGLGAGGLVVLAQAIIAEVVSPRERGRYQGYFGAVFGAASIGGPLLGGVLTDHASWRWVFYVNVPIGILALLATALVPASSRHGNPKIDYLGSTILAAAITCIVLFTTWGGTEYPWGSRVIVSLVVASVALVAVLLVVERRAQEPVLPLHLFRTRTFNVATSVSFIIGFATFGTVSFLPLFLQVVNGATATSSGLLLLPLMLGMIGTSAVTGQVTTRTGRYKRFPVVGCGLSATALYLLSTMGVATSRGTVTIYMVLLGAGIGFAMQTLVLAVQNVVRPADLGVATSSVNFFRSLGGSIGVAMFGALFNSLLSDRLGTTIPAGEAAGFTPEAVRRLPDAARTVFVGGFAESLTTVFLYATPVVLVAFALTWLLHEVPLRSGGPAVEGADPAAVIAARGEPEIAPSLLH